MQKVAAHRKRCVIVAGILRVEGTLARGNSRVQQCDRWGQGGVRLEGGQGCAAGAGTGERGGLRFRGQWHIQISVG